MPEHNYMKKVERLWREGKIPAGRLSELAIYHDGWCAIHRGGYCDCDPDVEPTRTTLGLFLGGGRNN